jgi:hypothetical protein
MNLVLSTHASQLEDVVLNNAFGVAVFGHTRPPHVYAVFID